jgi:hypothetical protein
MTFVTATIVRSGGRAEVGTVVVVVVGAVVVVVGTVVVVVVVGVGAAVVVVAGGGAAVVVVAGPLVVAGIVVVVVAAVDVGVPIAAVTGVAVVVGAVVAVVSPTKVALVDPHNVDAPYAMGGHSDRPASSKRRRSGDHISLCVKVLPSKMPPRSLNPITPPLKSMIGPPLDPCPSNKLVRIHDTPLYILSLPTYPPTGDRGFGSE